MYPLPVLLTFVQSLTLSFSIVGIFLSGILFFKRQVRTTSQLHFDLFLLVFSLTLLEVRLYWGEFYLDYPHLVLLTKGLPFLYGPLLLFYLKDKPWSLFTKTNYLHFAPFLLYYIIRLPFFVQGADEKLEFVHQFIQQDKSSQSLVFLLYFSAVFIHYFFYLLLMRNELKHAERSGQSMVWGRRIFAGFLTYTIVEFGIAALRVNGGLSTLALLMSTLMCVSCLMIGYIFVINVLAPELVASLQRSVGRRVVIKDAEKHLTFLEQLMVERKMYKNNDLKMIDVAAAASLTEGQISHLLNNHRNQNFNKFVNSYRIEEAKRLLKDPSFSNYTIEGIGQIAGFHSKTAFNETFRTVVGVTPSVYKRSDLAGIARQPLGQ